MERYELQKLRDLPIEGVAERLGMQVVRHKTLCPFHDDHHASLSFSVRRNTYRCFACGAHGGVIDLVMNYLHTGFLEACEWLGGGGLSNLRALNNLSNLSTPNTPSTPSTPTTTNWGFYERFFDRPFLSPEARKFLFDERKIDPRVVRWCRLTSWKDRRGVPWLQIPYYNREGRLVGIQNRNLVRGALPRFRFPQGSECGIYNLPVLNRLKPGDELWITEGCSDCWAMLSSGRKAIAIPSATLLKKKDKEQLLSLTLTFPLTFHMYPDQDAPGQRLFLQLKELLPSLQRHQLPADCKDFGEYYLARFPP